MLVRRTLYDIVIPQPASLLYWPLRNVMRAGGSAFSPLVKKQIPRTAQSIVKFMRIGAAV